MVVLAAVSNFGSSILYRERNQKLNLNSSEFTYCVSSIDIFLKLKAITHDVFLQMQNSHTFINDFFLCCIGLQLWCLFHI